MNESIIIVTGDPAGVFTCITAESRPDPSHAWSRAASHILHFKDMNYFQREDAARICYRVVEMIPFRPPKKAPVKWGWGKGWPGIH